MNLFDILNDLFNNKTYQARKFVTKLDVLSIVGPSEDPPVRQSHQLLQGSRQE
jgi:hypothetical protein